MSSRPGDDQDLRVLRAAVAEGRILWHLHALERMLERGISRADVLEAIVQGEVIERHPERRPFPSCLVLHVGAQPLHVVAAADSAAREGHVVTAYRPDLEHFEPDFRTRREPS